MVVSPLFVLMTLVVAGTLLTAMFLIFKQPNVHPAVDIVADIKAEAAEAQGNRIIPRFLILLSLNRDKPSKYDIQIERS